MPSLMFKHHDKHMRYAARELTLTCREVAVKVSKTLTNAIPEYYDFLKRRPIFIFLWNLRVVLLKRAVSMVQERQKEREREKPTDMTMFRIINMRVNASLCPQSKKSLMHSTWTNITSKIFQKYAGSVAPPPIALCKSISRNLPSYYIQRSSYLIRQKTYVGIWPM